MCEQEIYKATVELWSGYFQRLMVIEECAELINSLCKQFRGRVNSSEVLEEAIDVQIIINQLRFMLNDNDKWNEQMKFKLDRLKSRVKGEEINASR